MSEWQDFLSFRHFPVNIQKKDLHTCLDFQKAIILICRKSTRRKGLHIHVTTLVAIWNIVSIYPLYIRVLLLFSQTKKKENQATMTHIIIPCCEKLFLVTLYGHWTIQHPLTKIVRRVVSYWLTAHCEVNLICYFAKQIIHLVLLTGTLSLLIFFD